MGRQMTTIQILDATVEIEFLYGDNPKPMDEALILTQVGKMADLINSRTWEPRFKDAFEIMRKIVFFEGMIVVNTHKIDRPCCDEDDAIFYWEGSEFTYNPNPCTHAATFVHDCRHVVQFRAAGNSYATEAERVPREIDAIKLQLEVAKLLGCPQSDIDYWQAYEDNQAEIVARLEEGVDRMIYTRPDTRLA